MKKLTFIFACLILVLFACKLDENRNNTGNTQTIISNDSSGTTGRLIVRVFDFSTSNVIANADVFLYARYEDINRNMYLNTIRTNNSGQVDFGFILAGNYYLRATNGVKADTAIAQVITKHTITKNLFLK
jgi:hypothetical protein